MKEYLQELDHDWRQWQISVTPRGAEEILKAIGPKCACNFVLRALSGSEGHTVVVGRRGSMRFIEISSFASLDADELAALAREYGVYVAKVIVSTASLFQMSFWWEWRV